MFSQPHCSVELLGALHRFTVMGPTCWSLVAYSVFSSLCPDRMMLASAPSDSIIAPEGPGRAAAAPRLRAPAAPAPAPAAAAADAGLGRGDASGLPEYFAEGGAFGRKEGRKETQFIFYSTLLARGKSKRHRHVRRRNEQRVGREGGSTEIENLLLRVRAKANHLSLPDFIVFSAKSLKPKVLCVRFHKDGTSTRPVCSLPVPKLALSSSLRF